MLYWCSSSWLWLYTVELVKCDARLSGAGPTISEGHMMDCSFSKCKVSNRPDLKPCGTSRDEQLGVRLRIGMLFTTWPLPAWFCPWPGDTDREAATEEGLLVPVLFCRFPCLSNLSSVDERLADEKFGDGERRSSTSETWPPSSEAAKLLEMSGSEIYA